jgi:ribonuclease BN (tRNA processing enzyme)
VRLVRQPGGPASVDQVDTVLLSHLHLDHTADLAPLLFAQHSVLARQEGSLLVVGPEGTASYLDRLRGVWGDWLQPRLRRLEVREVQPGQAVPLPGGLATALPAHHPVPRFSSDALGWLFEDRQGHRLAYTGDTGPCPAQARAIGACDLLVSECSTPDDLAVDTHLSPAGVIDLIGNTRPQRVVLTHLYPLVASQAPAAAIAGATGVPTLAARDGDIIVIPEPREPTT